MHRDSNFYNADDEKQNGIFWDDGNIVLDCNYKAKFIKIHRPIHQKGLSLLFMNYLSKPDLKKTPTFLKYFL